MILVIYVDLCFLVFIIVILIVVGVISVGGEFDNYIGVMYLVKVFFVVGLIGKVMGFRFCLYDFFFVYSIMCDIGYSYL